MPYSAAVAISGARSDGGAAGGGIVSDGAGCPTVRMKLSKPAGSVTSRKRASGDVTTNVCGMSRGPKTNEPAGASMTSPPTQNASAPSMT